MKILIRLLMLMTAGLVLQGGEPEQTNRIFSGEEVLLPYNGESWTLKTLHGRVIAAGTGEIRLNLAALEPGATQEAELQIAGQITQKITIYSPQPLAGYRFFTPLEIRPAEQKILQKRGMKLVDADDNEEEPEPAPKVAVYDHFPADFQGSLALVFPAKGDFPLDLGATWQQVSLVRTAAGGDLSITMDNTMQVIDNKGNYTYAVLTRPHLTVVVFNTQFKLEQLENLLLLKQLINGVEEAE